MNFVHYIDGSVVECAGDECDCRRPSIPQPPAEPLNVNRLRFARWLVESGRLNEGAGR